MPGLTEFLQWLDQNEIGRVAVTNAPRCEGYGKWYPQEGGARHLPVCFAVLLLLFVPRLMEADISAALSVMILCGAIIQAQCRVHAQRHGPE